MMILKLIDKKRGLFLLKFTTSTAVSFFDEFLLLFTENVRIVVMYSDIVVREE